MRPRSGIIRDRRASLNMSVSSILSKVAEDDEYIYSSEDEELPTLDESIDVTGSGDLSAELDRDHLADNSSELVFILFYSMLLRNARRK